MKFSIIVPIYKVEKYLPQCIESVQNQSYNDYELILVDDGSPDQCPKICEEYAKNDIHIQVIHKQNGGLSAARNTGITAAKGDYIIFLDGDDCLNDNSLDNLASELEGNRADILIGNVLHWFEEEEIIFFDNKWLVDYSKNRSLSDLCEIYVKKKALIPWRAWQSAYRLDFIKDHQLWFDADIIGAEDCDYFFKLLPFVKNYILSECAIVKYRANREGSIVNKPSYNSIIGQLFVFKKLFDASNEFTNPKIMKTYFSDKFTNIIILVNKIQNIDEKKACLNFIKTNRYILSHCTKKPKYIVARLLWAIYGFDRGNSLLSKIHGK